ncbi:hypothetical protein MRX96_046772 [Rhipicephalus microplus]
MKAAFCVIGLLAALHLPLLAYCFEDFSGAGVETEDHHIGSMKEVVPTPTNAHSSWLPPLAPNAQCRRNSRNLP